MRCFWVAWAILAWLSAILCTAGCLFPYWLKGAFLVTLQTPNTTSSPVNKLLTSHLGLFRRCVYPIYTTGSQSAVTVGLQSTCGHYDFGDIPHLTWKLGLITLALSCTILFFITFFLFVSGFNLKLLTYACVYKICQFGFLVSGLLAMFTCIMYPVGWRHNKEISQICGPTADSFNFGSCEIGWAYILTICGGCASLMGTLLPCLFPLHPSYVLGKSGDLELTPNSQSMPLHHVRSLNLTDQSPSAILGQGGYSRNSSCVRGLNSMETSCSSNLIVRDGPGYQVFVPAGSVLLEPNCQP